MVEIRVTPRPFDFHQTHQFISLEAHGVKTCQILETPLFGGAVLVFILWALVHEIIFSEGLLKSL